MPNLLYGSLHTITLLVIVRSVAASSAAGSAAGDTTSRAQHAALVIVCITNTTSLRGLAIISHGVLACQLAVVVRSVAAGSAAGSAASNTTSRAQHATLVIICTTNTTSLRGLAIIISHGVLACQLAVVVCSVAAGSVAGSAADTTSR